MKVKVINHILTVEEKVKTEGILSSKCSSEFHPETVSPPKMHDLFLEELCRESARQAVRKANLPMTILVRRLDIRATILADDYRDAIENAQKGDFIYLDLPV